MATAELTAQRLRELLDYDPETGVFTWRMNRRGTARKGRRAGGASHTYIRIKVDGQAYLAHRLAWLYVNENWPVGMIDHRFGNGTDNRINGLRDVTRRTNSENQRVASKNNKTGLLGVHHGKLDGRWYAHIKTAGKSRHIGCFDTAEEAHAAYLAAKRRLHPGCTI